MLWRSLALYNKWQTHTPAQLILLMYLFINSCLCNRNITGRIYLKNSYLFIIKIMMQQILAVEEIYILFFLYVRPLLFFYHRSKCRICVRSRAFLPRNTSSDWETLILILDRYHQNGGVFPKWKQKNRCPIFKKCQKSCNCPIQRTFSEFIH